MVNSTAVWAVGPLHAFKNKSMSSLSVALCHPSQQMEFAVLPVFFSEGVLVPLRVKNLTLHYGSRESGYEITKYR